MELNPVKEIILENFVEQRWKLWLVESGLPSEIHSKFFQWGPVFHESDVYNKILDTGEKVVTGMFAKILFQSIPAAKILGASEMRGEKPNELNVMDRFIFDSFGSCPLCAGYETAKKDFKLRLEYENGDAQLDIAATRNYE